MKNIAFTIVAKNYIGLATILRKSYLEHNLEDDFHIYVVDSDESFEEAFVFSIESIFTNSNKLDLFKQLSFKYNLVEFCTCLKPHVFNHILGLEYDNISYLDPDILVFSSFADIYNKLERFSIILTPHIAIVSESQGPRCDAGIMQTGIFNLGFCSIANNNIGRQFINWWTQRLNDECFIDAEIGLFTDQKWIDFVPSLFFDNVYISNDLGCNLAPWNFHERKVIKLESSFLVEPRKPEKKYPSFKLVFVHFSGVNYHELSNGNIIQNNIDELIIEDDINLLFNCYNNKLQLDRDILIKYLNYDYQYGNFSNGKPVLDLHRRLYRYYIQNNNCITCDTFDVNSDFYKLLTSKNLIADTQNKAIKNHKSYDVDKKIITINKLFKFLVKMLGVNRYLLIIKFFKYFSKYKRQAFLIK